MKVLGIETATTVCAAALVHEGRILSEATVNEKYVHAERLMHQVDEVLREARCSREDIDGIAVSIGPGSFTGLRIGLSVAKGLSYAMDKELVAVPTLLALARRLVDGGVAREGESILSVLDARRDEVYCQQFRVMEGEAECLTEPEGVSLSDLSDRVVAGKTWVTGDGSSKLKASPWGNRAVWMFAPDRLSVCSAGSIGLVGELLFKKGKKVTTSALEPLYIKDFFFKQPS